MDAILLLFPVFAGRRTWEEQGQEDGNDEEQEQEDEDDEKGQEDGDELEGALGE